MKATVRLRDEIAILDLAGRLVYGDGQGELKQAVEGLLRDGNRRVVLNLENVPFIDSSGVVELVGCHKRACEAGAAMKLLNPSPKVRELLRVTQLSDVLSIFDDEETARRSFENG